jgi:hypothetical protein
MEQEQDLKTLCHCQYCKQYRKKPWQKPNQKNQNTWKVSASVP